MEKFENDINEINNTGEANETIETNETNEMNESNENRPESLTEENTERAKDGCENAESIQEDKADKQVRYYTDGGFADSKSRESDEAVKANRYSWNTLPTWGKALIIIALVIICIGLLTSGCNKLVDGFVSEFSDSFYSSADNSVVTDFGYDYIGVVHIEGTIDEEGTGTYNHEYILNSIDAMIDDTDNKGMVLYLDTPGGSVFASDELYFKIKEYQEKTERPVYSSMQSMAASGGYYISAPCDKIIANRNCWTGSIGVTLGTMYDVSELLDNLGIKTTTITSGANKAMGSSVEPMTSEQQAIYQSLVEEAYEQFVEIVAEGRNMKLSKVKKLADGRIYTAKQAVENGLADKIGSLEDALADMKKNYKLEDCEVETFQSYVSNDWTSLLGQAAGSMPSSLSAEAVEDLIELNGKFEFSYLCQVNK